MAVTLEAKEALVRNRGIKESFMTCSNDSHLRIKRSIDEEHGYPLNSN